MKYEIVLDAEASREDWLKHRKHGIGGSDIAAIVGENPWKTPLAVWLDKTSDVDDSGTSEAAEWGNRLEGSVREEFARRHPDLIVTGTPGMARSTVHPFALANVDGLATDLKRASVLEIKTTSDRNRHAWEPDTIPMYYSLQAAWYCEILGLDHAWFAVLVGGQHYLEREYIHDPALGEMLMIRAQRFWEQHVETLTPPPPDPLRDNNLLAQVWAGSPDDDPVDLDQGTAYTVWELHDIRAKIADLKDQEEALEVAVKAALGDHTVGMVDGQKLVSWKATKPSEYADVARLRAEHPDVWERVKKTRRPSRRFALHTTTTGDSK